MKYLPLQHQNREACGYKAQRDMKQDIIKSLVEGYKFFFIDSVIKDLVSLKFKNTSKVIERLRFLNTLKPFENNIPTKDFTAAHNVSLEIIGLMYY